MFVLWTSSSYEYTPSKALPDSSKTTESSFVSVFIDVNTSGDQVRTSNPASDSLHYQKETPPNSLPALPISLKTSHSDSRQAKLATESSMKDSRLQQIDNISSEDDAANIEKRRTLKQKNKVAANRSIHQHISPPRYPKALQISTYNMGKVATTARVVTMKLTQFTLKMPILIGFRTFCGRTEKLMKHKSIPLFPLNLGLWSTRPVSEI